MIFKRALSIHSSVTEFVAKRQNTKCFDNFFNLKWELISAPENEGTCLVELKIDEELVNVNKTLHGGAIASLVDAVTTIALFNTANKKPGISVNMNVNYLKAAKLNETILIEGKVTKAGSKLAYLEAKLFIKDSNSFELNKDRLVAVGFHTKYIS